MTTTSGCWPKVPAPDADKNPVAITQHGVTRSDEYHWLRADNWQAVMRDPETLPETIRAHLEAENAYCNAMLADTKELQDTLYKEMRGRIKEDDSSVPAPDGPYAYGIRYEIGDQYPRAIRTPRDGGQVELLLDVNVLAKGHDYCAVANWSHSRDHKRLAYAIDTNGSEIYQIRIRDLSQGKDTEDIITGVASAFEWAEDNETLFYVWQDENHRPCRIYRHHLGTSQSEDVLVYEEADPGFFISLSQTQSGRYLTIHCHDHSTSEVHIIDAACPCEPPRCYALRDEGVEYTVDDHENRFLIITNADGAEDFKIMHAPLDATSRTQWEEFAGHKTGRLRLAHTCFANHLVWLETENALPRIVVHRFSDGERHHIAFDEEAYTLYLSDGYEYATDQIRFTYSSPTTPEQTFDYDMNTRKRVLRKTREVPSGHDPANYVVRRVMAPARDGETIPLTVLSHRQTGFDAKAPCLLYGYGAYGISIPAGFFTSVLSLVDRGFVYAIAHIRGGKEKGYNWYAQTRTSGKQRTFDDYIDAGRYLVAEGYVAQRHVVGCGGSAGGLLMGVVANQAPELFAGILAAVPFVDTLNTMLDETLPLTPLEWPEWGNPISSRDSYETIAAYSPYDNIATRNYPAILATGGLTDPRVTYWEPAKWVARVRDHTTSNAPVLLHMKMGAGHGGASGRFDALKDLAREYAFAIKAVENAHALEITSR